MRQFTLMSLLIGLAACDSASRTSPESTAISVRVRDDRGVSAGRNQVIVTLPGMTHVNAQTGSDGTAYIRVVDAGVYRVWVVPRNGYVGGTDSLSKRVTVAANARAVVDFTVHRGGVSTAEPPPER